MQTQSVAYANEDGPTVLGEKLPNPYTPENMQQAKTALDDEGIVSEKAFSVRTTHYYVKFMPNSEAQLRDLYRDTTITLYDVPLDYDLEVVGNWYRAPDLTDSMPTPQYAAVKKDFQFNSAISYDILSELYIPEEDETLIGNKYDENLSYMVALLNRANELTGGTLEPFTPIPDPSDPGNGGGIYYNTPNGTILTFDSRLGHNIGLEGVKVTAKRWFTTHTGYTDANGAYILNGSFVRKADYTIHFQRYGFIIADYTVPPYQSIKYSKVVRNNIPDNHWDYTIQLGYENMQSHVFRAAYRYYYKDIDGLSRPNYPARDQLIIAKNSSKNWSGYNFVFMPILKIARFNSNNEEYDSDEIFSSTIHEIAHTSLSKKVGLLNFIALPDLFRESWSVAVEWVLTSKEYKGLGISNYGDWNYNPPNPPQYPNQYGFQYWNSTRSSEYTSLFINLIDDFNEFGNFFQGYGNGLINDQVSGYSISNLESNILPNASNLQTLSAVLKTQKPSGVSDNQIDLLLSYY